MNELENILIGKGSENISAILLYGNFNETFISDDLVFRSFYKYLADKLKEAGFDNVCFYDNSHTFGKFVFDEESAYYSMNVNRAPYFKKYGKIPAGAPEPDEPQELGAGGFSFGEESADSTFTDTEQQFAAGDDTQGITSMQRNIGEIAFYGELYNLMTGNDFRSAVIITDIYELLQRGSPDGIAGKISQLINGSLESKVGNNGNLLIFLAPDVHDSRDSYALRNALISHSLINKFMIEVRVGDESDGDVWVFDQNRAFAVNPPADDELELMLNRYSMEQKIEVDVKEVPDLAKKLGYLLREGYEQRISEGAAVRPATLWDVDQRLREIIKKDKGLKLDSDKLLLLSPFSAKLDQDPLETLKNTKGWEKAADAILGRLNSFMKLYPQYDKTRENGSKNNTGNRILSKRFLGSEDGMYPTAEELCHIMFTGPPGVGKTTIARLLGRIFTQKGLLESGHVVVAKASDLISGHVGGTYHLVERALRRAEGGILYIDEAYEFYEDPNEHRAGNYRAEAVNVLVQALTDNHRHFLLVLSGYSCSSPDSKDGVEALFSMNPGFESRVKTRVKIEPYSPALLEEIFENELTKKGFKLGKGINKQGLKRLSERIKRTSTRTFANARTIINYADEIMSNAFTRIPETESGEKLIIPEDFPEDVRGLLGGDEIDFGKLLEEIKLKAPGLGEIAADIINKAYIRQQRRSSRLGDTDDSGIYSMIFAGRPGSGKTTIAKLLVEIFGKIGLLSANPPVIIEDSAHCQPDEFRKKIKEASDFNTLLMIDEAYQMPAEYLTMLLSPMTEEGLLCIFCMYQTEVENFLKKNSGISSRVDIYPIPDYTPETMIEIFKVMADKEKYEYSDELINDLKIYFKNRYDIRETIPEYANARDIANLLREMSVKCDQRCSSAPYRLISGDLPEKVSEIIGIQKKSADLDSVLEEFNSYVGLDNVKAAISSINDAFVFNKKFDVEEDNIVGHYVFTGAPGTGKTTAAKLFARALYSIGALKTPRLVELSARNLIGQYIGETAQKCRKALEAGKFGVIFIDEAYMLSTTSNNRMSTGNYREEAVAELLLFLEEELGKTAVIFAGYPYEIENLLDSNPGFRSRVSEIVEFPDYSVEECLEILINFFKKKDSRIEVTKEAEKVLRDVIEERKKSKDFANARTARKISDKVMSRHRKRINAEAAGPDHDRLKPFVITEDDARIDIKAGELY